MSEISILYSVANYHSIYSYSIISINRSREIIVYSIHVLNLVGMKNDYSSQEMAFIVQTKLK